MRKNFGAKPWTYPQPVYIIGTYDVDGIPNAMNAAWGGISGYSEISFCLGSGHKTVDNLKKTGAFTVSIATEKTLKACDFVGLVSGNKEKDKFEKAGFHAIKSEFVNAPLIEELGLTLECKVKTYDEETGILRGEIVNVSVDEEYLVDDKVDVKKLQPIVFDSVNLAYWTMGEKVGDAYGSGKALMK